MPAVSCHQDVFLSIRGREHFLLHHHHQCRRLERQMKSFEGTSSAFSFPCLDLSPFPASCSHKFSSLPQVTCISTFPRRHLSPHSFPLARFTLLSFRRAHKVPFRTMNLHTPQTPPSTYQIMDCAGKGLLIDLGNLHELPDMAYDDSAMKTFDPISQPLASHDPIPEPTATKAMKHMRNQGS